ncbi:MAG: hypothetical protein IJO94_07520 [Firmicutes bacterium]|nr:hypothetical protein [Bacillota bacterium]
MAKKCSACAPYIRTALWLLAALWLWGNGEYLFAYFFHGSFSAVTPNAATQVALLGDILLPVLFVGFVIYRVIRKKRSITPTREK